LCLELQCLRLEIIARSASSFEKVYVASSEAFLIFYLVAKMEVVGGQVEVIYRLLPRRLTSDFTLELECLRALLPSLSVTDGLYGLNCLDRSGRLPAIGLGCCFVIVLLLVR